MAQLSRIYRKFRIIINLKAILANLDGSDPKKPYFLTKIGINKRFLATSGFRRSALILTALLLPISASAGLFSIFWTDNNEENLVIDKNLQNMSLLVASAAPLASNQSLASPTIEDDALVSGGGPLGFDSGLVTHKPTSDQISVYVVRKGDTLSQIAKMFDVTVNTIKWGNDLDSSALREGQTLVILPISGVKHTVVKGDTLDSLAKKYKGDKEEILAYNNLEDETLSVGSVIIIPDGEVTVSTGSRLGTSVVKNGSGLKEYAGYYMRPVVGGKKTQGIHGYNGIDIGAPVGTPILAAADGEVIISRSGGWNGGYGNYVVIRHNNGTQTLYAHNSSNKVSVGDIVKQGDVIASMGATGKATGPHVHFEIRGAKNPF